MPQGDGYSANGLTYYLAKSLHQTVDTDHSYAAPVNICTMTDHNYSAPIESIEVDLEMEYADDLTYVTTCGKMFTIKRNEIPPKLKPRSLNINLGKTEEFVVTRNGEITWRKCKLLGSLLGTEEDIKRRKGAIRSKRDVFYSNMDIVLKMRAFNVYIGSIFLYNSELWGADKSPD